MICRYFKVLPSNPDFKNLTPLQLLWIASKIKQDSDQEQKAYKAMRSESSNEILSIGDDFTTDDFLSTVSHIKNS